jgi:hypothetical protein
MASLRASRRRPKRFVWARRSASPTRSIVTFAPPPILHSRDRLPLAHPSTRTMSAPTPSKPTAGPVHHALSPTAHAPTHSGATAVHSQSAVQFDLEEELDRSQIAVDDTNRKASWKSNPMVPFGEQRRASRARREAPHSTSSTSLTVRFYRALALVHACALPPV